MCILLISNISGQTIGDINIIQNNKNLEVDYKIDSCNKRDRFSSRVEFYYSDQKKIPAKSIFLTSPSCSQINRITWNSSDDNIVLNDRIYAEIYIKRELNVRLRNHLSKSILFPGLGDYKLRNGKYHILYGIVGYGLIGTALYLQHRANENYQNYRNSYEIDESDKYFETSIRQRNLSYALLGGAAVVWTIDILGIINKTKRVRRNPVPKESNYYYQLANQEFSGKSKTVKIDTRTEYDIAMDNGRSFVIEGDSKIGSNEEAALTAYKQAKNYFEKALVLEQRGNAANNELLMVNKSIDNLKEKQKRYKGLIQDADKLFSEQSLNEALEKYETAQKIYPGKSYSKEKISEIRNILEQNKLRKQYEDLIVQADNAFEVKNYENARDLYLRASKVLPKESYPGKKIDEIKGILLEQEYNSLMAEAKEELERKNYEEARSKYELAGSLEPDKQEPKSKIAFIDNKITEIEQARIDKGYRKNIEVADAAYNNKEYDKAKTYYQKASTLKPAESYPKNRIESINNLLEIAVEQKQSLSELYKVCKDAVFFVIASGYLDASLGSGFFINDKGVAISNYHVFEGNYRSKIYTNDGGEYEITVLEKNREKDYIIFKVKNPGSKKFKYVNIASTLPDIGENVFAIGNPEGFDQTLSNGIISGYRDSENFGKEFYIQTNTAISHGSSGGPLFNSKGEVIGITTMGSQEGSLFFAINIKKVPYRKYLY